jgi:hypothetical protein
MMHSLTGVVQRVLVAMAQAINDHHRDLDGTTCLDVEVDKVGRSGVYVGGWVGVFQLMPRSPFKSGKGIELCFKHRLSRGAVAVVSLGTLTNVSFHFRSSAL